ncbi:MAG: hypothetical protein ACP5MW_00560 [Thermoplasmata archaeon]
MKVTNENGGILYTKIATIGLVTIFLLLSFEGVGKGSVVTGYNYNTSGSSESPMVIYQNHSYPNLWNNTHQNSYHDQVYMNITSHRWTGTYCDEQGNTFFVDTNGSTWVEWAKDQNKTFSLGSPYYPGGPNSTAKDGLIVGIAASNSSANYLTYGGSIVMLLSRNGSVFEFNYTSGVTTAKWVWLMNAGLTNRWSNWTSITNDEASIYTQSVTSPKYYMYMDYYFSTSTGYITNYVANYGTGKYVTTSKQSPSSIISIVDYEWITNGGSAYYVIYGLSFNGSVLGLFANGWAYSGFGIPNGARSITLRADTSKLGFWLYVVMVANDTYIYTDTEITVTTTNGITPARQTFFPSAEYVDTYGTNEAIAFNMDSAVWWGWVVLQTNGSFAITDNINNTAWFHITPLAGYYTYHYNDVLRVVDLTSAFKFNIYAQKRYLSTTWNFESWQMWFNNSNNSGQQQFFFFSLPTSVHNPENPMTITSIYYVSVNISFVVNMAYNTTINFYLYIYHLNSNGYIDVQFVYILDITMINHFSFIKI